MGKILVTGGAGFIGSYIADELIKEGHAVRILDNLDKQVHPEGKKPSYLNPKAEFMLGDVTKINDLEEALKEVATNKYVILVIRQQNFQRYYTIKMP